MNFKALLNLSKAVFANSGGSFTNICNSYNSGVSQGPLPVINVVIKFIYHPPKFNLAPEELPWPNRKVWKVYCFRPTFFRDKLLSFGGVAVGIATFGGWAKSPSGGLKSPSGGLRGTWTWQTFLFSHWHCVLGCPGKKVRIPMVGINGLFHLRISQMGHIEVISHWSITFDPNFLPGASKYLSFVLGKHWRNASQWEAAIHCLQQLKIVSKADVICYSFMVAIFDCYFCLDPTLVGCLIYDIGDYTTELSWDFHKPL